MLSASKSTHKRSLSGHIKSTEERFANMNKEKEESSYQTSNAGNNVSSTINQKQVTSVAKKNSSKTSLPMTNQSQVPAVMKVTINKSINNLINSKLNPDNESSDITKFKEKEFKSKDDRKISDTALKTIQKYNNINKLKKFTEILISEKRKTHKDEKSDALNKSSNNANRSYENNINLLKSKKEDEEHKKKLETENKELRKYSQEVILNSVFEKNFDKNLKLNTSNNSVAVNNKQVSVNQMQNDRLNNPFSREYKNAIEKEKEKVRKGKPQQSFSNNSLNFVSAKLNSKQPKQNNQQPNNSLSEKNKDTNTSSSILDKTSQPKKKLTTDKQCIMVQKYIDTKVNQMVTKSKLNVTSPYKRDSTSYITSPEPRIVNKSITNILPWTQVGFSGEHGPKKINQDAYFIYENFSGDKEAKYIGVCDGHGTFGHLVSNFLKENLPIAVEKAFLEKSNQKYLPYQQIFEETFNVMNNRFLTEFEKEVKFSGSTCSSLVITNQKIVCANLGDSRVVLGQKKNGFWNPIQLTRDHKPSEEDERQRIENSGGRVQCFKDDDGENLGPDRVFLKDYELPGLAMSRSFGDSVAASVGVSCVPEINERSFASEDCIIIVASDGLWEFLSNKEVIEAAGKFYESDKDAKGATEYLTHLANKRWIRQDEIVDDITLIIVFLE